MQINLSPELESMITAQMALGGFDEPSDLVNAALRNFLEPERQTYSKEEGLEIAKDRLNELKAGNIELIDGNQVFARIDSWLAE